MYLQNSYRITATTDINVLEPVFAASDFDVIIMDAEPTEKIADLCKKLKMSNNNTPVILTYVYRNQIKELESGIKQYVNSIFYKPFDLNEVSSKLSALMVN
jgi:DNA-binding response OmpR family regulator